MSQLRPELGEIFLAPELRFHQIFEEALSNRAVITTDECGPVTRHLIPDTCLPLTDGERVLVCDGTAVPGHRAGNTLYVKNL